MVRLITGRLELPVLHLWNVQPFTVTPAKPLAEPPIAPDSVSMNTQSSMTFSALVEPNEMAPVEVIAVLVFTKEHSRTVIPLVLPNVRKPA